MRECSAMKQYKPNPIDISDVTLPTQKKKIAETSNDTLKHNPCLVPYSKLPESEKVYDRDTAVCTLKAILKLGFKIEEA